MYHRKYWLVQTLLKVTKAKVWASIVDGREDLERRGRRIAERRSCGTKARVVKGEELVVLEEVRYKSVL